MTWKTMTCIRMTAERHLIRVTLKTSKRRIVNSGFAVLLASSGRGALWQWRGWNVLRIEVCKISDCGRVQVHSQPCKLLQIPLGFETNQIFNIYQNISNYWSFLYGLGLPSVDLQLLQCSWEIQPKSYGVAAHQTMFVFPTQPFSCVEVGFAFAAISFFIIFCYLSMLLLKDIRLLPRVSNPSTAGNCGIKDGSCCWLLGANLNSITVSAWSPFEWFAVCNCNGLP